MEIKIAATITCPLCNHRQTAQMPTEACQYFFKCEECEETMSPKKGDCCVFCSYADHKCQPKQIEEKN